MLKKDLTIDILTPAVNSYLANCAEKNIVPLLTELALEIGIDQRRLSELRKHKEYPKHAPILDKIQQAQEIGLLRQMLRKKTTPIAEIFLLKALHQYRDQEAVIDISIPLGVVQLPPRYAQPESIATGNKKDATAVTP